MAAPNAAFTVIPLADVDPDSPVTTDLMNALRLNDQNLFAQIVGDSVGSPTFTPAAEHNHDGLNSALIDPSDLQPIPFEIGTITISGTVETFTAEQSVFIPASVNFIKIGFHLQGPSAGGATADGRIRVRGTVSSALSPLRSVAVGVTTLFVDSVSISGLTRFSPGTHLKISFGLKVSAPGSAGNMSDLPIGSKVEDLEGIKFFSATA